MGSEYVRIFTTSRERNGHSGKKLYKYYCKHCNKSLSSIMEKKTILCRFCGTIARREIEDG